MKNSAIKQGLIAPVLFLLGLALACGAEGHPELSLFLLQLFTGFGLAAAGLLLFADWGVNR